MITIEGITSEMKRIEQLRYVAKIKPGVLKKERKRYAWLGEVKAYLETSPRADYLMAEIKRIEKEIESVEGAYLRDYPNSNSSKFRAEYMKIHNIPKLKEQYKTLKYILNK